MAQSSSHARIVLRLVRAANPSERTWVLPSGLSALGMLVGVIAMIAHIPLVLVIGGLMIAAGIAWAVLRLKTAKAVTNDAGEFGPTYFTPVDLVGLYWHIVDLIWIFLFPLLYLIH